MNSPDINFKNIWKPLAVGAALAFLYFNVLVKLGTDWWTDENYSHGLLIPFVIGLIVWLEFDDLKKSVAAPRFWLGGALIVLSLLMIIGGTLGAELLTQRLSFVLMIAGIVVYFFGVKLWRLLAAPFALLLLAIPIPQIVFNKIAFPLQIWASQAAVWGIRACGVPTVRKGNVFEILPQGATQIIALEVVEACSGIRSLMTLVTLALVLAYFTSEKNDAGPVRFWRNADFRRAVILMAAAIPIAVLTNAARVTATGVAAYYYGKRATEGVFHETSGWLVYVVALGLLIGVNYALKKVLGANRQTRKPDSEARGTEIAEVETNAAPRPSPARLRSAAPLLIVVMLLGGAFIAWTERRGEAVIARASLADFPQTVGDWRQKGNEIKFSPQTESVLRVSDYTMREYIAPNGVLANVYVGYYASQKTGATYHSPQNCLPGAGWTMREPETISIQKSDGGTFSANRYIIENGIYKEVMIYWYQGRGRVEPSEYQDKISTVYDSVTRRRSDGALIRVMTSVGGDEREAERRAADLSAQIAERLTPFVPE